MSAFALLIPPEETAARVARRVDAQFGQGLLNEMRGLLSAGVPATAHPFTGLVYRQALEHLQGVRDDEATRELIVRENRKYSRRQLIWFRKEPNLQWIHAAGERDETRQTVARSISLERHPFDRVILIVLDSVGIGELPDAAAYGDEGSNTLGNIHRRVPLAVPTLRCLGLDAWSISAGLAPLPPVAPSAAWPNGPPARTPSRGTGRSPVWCSIVRFRPFPTAFPREVIAEFERRIGRGSLGNTVASGTAIIDELGEEHVRTGQADRLYVGRQRLSDRRARRGRPHRRALRLV